MTKPRKKTLSEILSEGIDAERVRIATLAEELGCPGNIRLARYIDGLNNEIARLDNMICELEDRD